MRESPSLKNLIEVTKVADEALLRGLKSMVAMEVKSYPDAFGYYWIRSEYEEKTDHIIQLEPFEEGDEICDETWCYFAGSDRNYTISELINREKYTKWVGPLPSPFEPVKKD